MIAYYLYPLFFFKKSLMHHSLHYPHLIVTIMMQTQIKPSKKYTRSYIEGQQKMHAKNVLDKLDMRNFQLHRVWKWAMRNSMHLQNPPSNTVSLDSPLTIKALTILSKKRRSTHYKWTSLFFLQLVWRPGGRQQQCLILCSDADLSLSPNDSDMPNMYYYSN